MKAEMRLYRRVFDFSNPKPSMIDIYEIAECLSRECRFANQTPVHYSVAEHSVLAMRMAAQDGHGEHLQKAILLHDAPEAYMRDIPSPLKRLLHNWDEIEDRVMQVINDKFDVYASKFDIKTYDNAIYREEEKFFYGTEATTCRIHCWSAPRAKMHFLREARRLGLCD